MTDEDLDERLRQALGEQEQAEAEQVSASSRTVADRQTRRAAESGQRAERHLRILVVDDDSAFLDGMIEAAKHLSAGGEGFAVEAIKPSAPIDVIDAIRAAETAGRFFDLLLLDYELNGERLTAKHVLTALNDSKHAHVRYLPRLVITNQPVEVTIALPDLLLGLGADGIHLYKGGGVTAQAATGSRISHEQVLNALRLSDHKEIRVRAWGRLWRDVRNRIEQVIAGQRDMACTNQTQYLDLLAQVWHPVADGLRESRYASRANLRVFDGPTLESIDPDDDLIQNGFARASWDELSYVENWLNKAQALAGDWTSPLDMLKYYGDFIIESLTSEQIGQERLRGMLEGKPAIGMPLFTHHGPIGLFTLVREADDPPFGATDWEQMLNVGLRLALHAQDLRSRWCTHDRRHALNRLQTAIGEQSDDDEIWRLVVSTVHEQVFTRIQGLHGTGQMPPSDGVDSEGRSSLRFMAANRDLIGWGRGFGVPGGAEQVVKLKDLGTERDWLIAHVFDEGQEMFHVDTNGLKGSYKPPEPGANRSLIQVPIMANGICIAALAIGHCQAYFFGQSDEQSSDLRFLRECAAVVGALMAQRRNARLQTEALDLILALAKGEGKGEVADEAEWIGRVVTLLDNDAVGCAGVLWLKPEAGEDEPVPWRLARAWRFDKGHMRLAPVAETEMVEWKAHVIDNWAGSFCANTNSPGDPLVNFTDREFICDSKLTGVETRAQLNLRITQTDRFPSFAMLVLLFAVPAPMVFTPQRRDFLDRLARLCALYLQDREHLLALADSQALAERYRAWQDAYSQLYHQLRSQKIEIDERFGDCLRDLRRGHDAVDAVSRLRNDMDRKFTSISASFEASAVLTRPLRQTWLSLAPLVKSALTQGQRAKALGATLSTVGPLERWEVNTDSNLLKIALANLIDNALDEIGLQLEVPEKRNGRPARPAEAPPPTVEIRWALAGETISGRQIEAPCLLVRDNGPGVTAAKQTNIFDGVSNKAAGSGFQLRFSRDGLAGQGWRLDYLPQDAPGACFAITPPPKDIREMRDEEK